MAVEHNWGEPGPRPLVDDIDRMVARNVDRPMSDKMWKRLRRAARKWLSEHDPAEVRFDNDDD